MNDYFELFLFGIAMIFVTMPVFAALDKADDVHEGVMMGTLILAMMGPELYRNHPNGLCYLHTEPKENARGYIGDAVCVEPDDFCSYGEPKEG